MKTGSQLQHDSGAEFLREFSLHAGRIGVMDLVGDEGNYAKKRDAERTVKRLTAIRALAIDLTIQRREFKRRSGSDIAGPATYVERCSSNLPKNQVVKQAVALNMNRYVLRVRGSSEKRPGPGRYCTNPKPSRWHSCSRVTRCPAVALP